VDVDSEMGNEVSGYISKMENYIPGFHWFSLVFRFPETGKLETWKVKGTY
jgi:hypothetical protein